MERIKSLGVTTPVLTVNNREHNLNFYRQTLGFKVWHEESAFADLGTAADSDIKLILEESPSMRSRKVKGEKKLGKIIVRAVEPAEIESLLARGAAYSRLYRGKAGWAFEAVSPEGDVFLLHSEADAANLSPAEAPAAFADLGEDFTYLTDFVIEQIIIRTPDVAESQAFYGKMFKNHRLLRFVEGEGPDLRVDNHRTWDLAGLEFNLTEPVSLRAIQADLALLGIEAFVDVRATFLTLQDPNGLDLTFRP